MSRPRFGLNALAILATLACLAVAAPALADAGRTTQHPKLAEFTRVRVVFPVSATITEGDHTACSVTLDNALVGQVRARVKDGTLIVDRVGHRHILHVHHGVDLDCTVKKLTALTIDSAAEVTIHGGKAVHDLELKINGAGSVKYTGTAGRMRLDLDGAADIVLTGKASRLEVALNGTGSVDASGLTATDADVAVDGAGSAQVTLGGGRAKLRVNGVGSIDWGGTVSALDAHAGMLGSIDRRG